MGGAHGRAHGKCGVQFASSVRARHFIGILILMTLRVADGPNIFCTTPQPTTLNVLRQYTLLFLPPSPSPRPRCSAAQLHRCINHSHSFIIHSTATASFFTQGGTVEERSQCYATTFKTSQMYASLDTPRSYRDPSTIQRSNKSFSQRTTTRTRAARITTPMGSSALPRARTRRQPAASSGPWIRHPSCCRLSSTRCRT